MARRPVYITLKKAPFVDVFTPEFQWNSGFSATQKQKNIVAFHQAYLQRFPDRQILEISSKSMQDIGIQLSAFHLKRFCPEIGKSVPLECVFQGSKVFASGGPYTDLYTVTPREAKRDLRLKESGKLVHFLFDGHVFPLSPATAFYDWQYIQGLKENSDLAQALTQYDAFTDIAFNPDKSLNCQARSAALYVSLVRLGLLEQIHCFDDFLSVLNGSQGI